MCYPVTCYYNVEDEDKYVTINEVNHDEEGVTETGRPSEF